MFLYGLLLMITISSTRALGVSLSRTISRNASFCTQNQRLCWLAAVGNKGFGQFITKQQRQTSSTTSNEVKPNGKLDSLLQTHKATRNRIFDETVKFPTMFTIKVIGVNDEAFIRDTVQLATRILGNKRHVPHEVKSTSQGNYISITLSPSFQTSAELYALYDALGQDKRVKFLL